MQTEEKVADAEKRKTRIKSPNAGMDEGTARSAVANFPGVETYKTSKVFPPPSSPLRNSRKVGPVVENL